jgi:hypothetical protein
MKTLAIFLFLLLALSGASLPAQDISFPSINAAAAVTGMVRDTAVTPCTANTTSYVTSVNCSLGSVPAGDTGICSLEAGDSGPAIRLTDNLNGLWDMDMYGITGEGGYHEYLMIYSFANMKAGATTVTISFSISVNATGASCAAYKGGRTTSVLDPKFYGWNDSGTSTHTPTLSAAETQASAGGLVYCAMSTGRPGDSVVAGANFALVGPNATNAIFPEVWGQATPTSVNCPYTVTPADSFTDAALAFLPSTAAAGIRPYQGMIETFQYLTSGAAPSVAGLSVSVSGGNPGWFGPEIAYSSNAFWTVHNTHADLTGSTAGPTAGLSSTLYLPAQNPGFTTAKAFTTYNGNSPRNLQLVTGQTGDGVSLNILPSATALSYGYYIEWDIPKTDPSSHAYGLGGAMTGHPSSLMLRLAPTGATMDVDMVGGASGSTVEMGTGSPLTTYWVTGKWITGGTLSMSYYSGCPSACSLLGSKTIADTSNTYPATSFLLGVASGTQATGDHIWWRNFKMCPGATYPCLP